eukprot:2586339-Pyramimonas_sp.AAC.1
MGNEEDAKLIDDLDAILPERWTLGGSTWRLCCGGPWRAERSWHNGRLHEAPSCKARGPEGG